MVKHLQFYEHLRKDKTFLPKFVAKVVKEMIKLHEKQAYLEERKLEPKERQERIDKAIEGYSFRP